MGEEELAQVISFFEQTKLPIGGLIGLEDLPADKNQEFRWRFELGKPLVKPELVNKLPTKICIFHDWYLKKSAEGLEMFGMLLRLEILPFKTRRWPGSDSLISMKFTIWTPYCGRLLCSISGLAFV
jgi:hypothetical protein